MVQHRSVWATFNVFTVMDLPLAVENCYVRSHTLSTLATTTAHHRPLIPPTPYLPKIIFGVETEGVHADWHLYTHAERASYTSRPRRICKQHEGHKKWLLSPHIIYTSPVVQEWPVKKTYIRQSNRMWAMDASAKVCSPARTQNKEFISHSDMSHLIAYRATPRLSTREYGLMQEGT